MDDIEIKQFKTRIKKRIPLLIFLALSTIAFILASTLLLEDSYKDILIIAMIWSLPLFIH